MTLGSKDLRNQILFISVETWLFFFEQRVALFSRVTKIKFLALVPGPSYSTAFFHKLV